jgi:hypothetical protein
MVRAASALKMPRKSRFSTANSGGIAAGTAIAGPVLFAMLGLAVDYGAFTHKLTVLQAAADAAAVATARELAVSNGSKTTLSSVANAVALANVSASPEDIKTSVVTDDATATVKVDVEETWTPFLGQFIGMEITPITVSASATLAGQANVCLLALDPAEEKSIEMNKSARVLANGCGVYANATASQSITLKNDSSIKAELVCSAGGVSARSGSIEPEATTDCPQIDDPLLSRTPPGFSKVCDHTDFNVSSGKATLDPGRYCGGITIGGHADVSFNEGDYVIEGAPFSVSGHAKIHGQYVSFYFEGDDALLEFTGNSEISLEGARSGPMAGLLMFEDRSAPAGRSHVIKSDSAHTLTGTIYFPRGELRINPNGSVAENSAYTAIIAGRLRLFEGPQLVLNSDYGSTEVPVPDGIRAATQVVLSK